MHRPLSLFALACALAACSPERGPDASRPLATAKPAEAPVSGEKAEHGVTGLTVYSGDYEALGSVDSASAGMPGYALVARPLQYTLKSGRNAVSFGGVPPSMDVEAALLRPRSPGVTVESQRHVSALSGSGDVISQVLGQRVTVEHTVGGAKQTDSGTLLSATDGLTLALGDGRIKVIRDYDNFSIVDGARLLPQEAALQWTVAAEAGGTAEFLLSYPMGGMAWRAEYLATLTAGSECRLELDGAALVANRSGVTFSQAKLTLLAGEPNRERRDESAPEHQALGSRQTAADAGAAAPSRRSSGEYHAYDLPGTIRLGNGATERVALFAQRPSVACTRGYVVDSGGPQWEPASPVLEPGFRGLTGSVPVSVAVTVENTKGAGLGQPLPAGRVRVFDGNELLGESRLQHTPAGGELRLEVGKAFDLGAQREVTDFRVDRAGRTITESFAITLANAKATDVNVRVVEPMPRWSDWKLLSSSVPGVRKDAQHAEFHVPVPAGGETRLTYTVRYQWAPGAIR
ncbi:MAG: DUF4139 domain-containing protein [Lysobacter sp.]|nr:DUF4139 domain-containing protein [Lysobacter sp.]MDQ3269549.1 DUF4139 domain-containing protein [Pseudomonadota bacterium]